MTSLYRNTRPTAVRTRRPTALPVTGARLQVHARNHPIGYTAYGSGIAGAAAILLAMLMAAPALTDPTGAPGWMLTVTLATGLLAYLYARGFPRVEESGPVRYTAARLQAFSGGLGPGPNGGRTARGMVDHLIHTASPSYAVTPLLIVAVTVSARILSEAVGTGFDPWILFQFTPIAIMLVAMVALYGSAKHKRTAAHTAVIASHDGYDAAP